MEFVDTMEWKDFKNYQKSQKLDNISVVAPGPVELTKFGQDEPYMKYLENANLPPFEIKKEFEITTMSAFSLKWIIVNHSWWSLYADGFR